MPVTKTNKELYMKSFYSPIMIALLTFSPLATQCGEGRCSKWLAAGKKFGIAVKNLDTREKIKLGAFYAIIIAAGLCIGK
jgi:hypothetical protein